MQTMNQDEINATIFRAYDIRGIVDVSLTENVAELIGKAVGSLLKEKNGNKIVVARDGRLSGSRLSAALCKGLMAAGLHVYDLGVVPTPVLYYATQFFKERSGIMLTGSHNPPDYNGMKIVIAGKNLAEEGITEIYHKIKAQQFLKGTGSYQRHEINEQYIQEIGHNVILQRPLKIVIDAGNGVTGGLAPQLFKSLGCKVVELFCDIDGNFPNHHPDPGDIRNLQTLIEKVKAEKADLGLAFDGDGDRLGVVTNTGEIIFPDRLLMLFAIDVLAKISQAKIIYDVKCTSHLHEIINKYHGTPIMWKTGHSLIKVKMAECNAQLGGEMSGHFFFKDRWNGFDDALYAGARLLEILAAQTQSSSELFATIPNSVNTPELKVVVKDEEKFSVMANLIAKANFKEATDITTIDGLRVHFDEGWGLIRASNTSPYLILRFEAINETILTKIQTIFKHWLLSVEPNLVLPF